MGLRICSLASGSSGNATYVAGEHTALLIDCGPSAREVVARLEAIGTHPSQLAGVLITHAHTDHYRSAGTLQARFGWPIYVDPETARVLRHRGRHTSWRRVQETRPIPDRIGEIEIECLPTSHGFPPHEGRTQAFLLRAGCSRVGIVTDLGIFSEDLGRRLFGIDALVLEANYDEATISRKLSDPSFRRDWPYLEWVQSDYGHLSNRQCAEALVAVVTERTSHVFLGHVSENHNLPHRDNNDARTAMEEIRATLVRHGVPLPQLHRTHRIGREDTWTGTVVEV